MSDHIYERGLARGQEHFFLVFVGLNSLLSGSSAFFRSFAKFTKSTISMFRSRCLGTGCKSGIRWWENCIVYCLFCIFIIIVISSSSGSIYFVALLNWLYLNPWVSLFVLFSCPSHWGGGEGWASGCLVLSCRLPG